MNDLIQCKRFAGNPLITPESSATLGDNINGPSVIKAPAWLSGAPGPYLMYFAHHKGLSIRLASAPGPGGPWTVYEPGSLALEHLEHLGFAGHVASPDVHIDEENKRLVMFFHAPHQGLAGELPPGLITPFGQASGVAFSTDGVTFEPTAGILGPPYMRVWWRARTAYALAVRGLLLRYQGQGWPDGGRLFEERTAPLGDWRHCAVLVRGDSLYVFFSQYTKDAPERILYAWVDTAGDWEDWVLSEPVELLRPQGEAEGGHLPLRPPEKGLAEEPVHELRDPCIFEDGGRVFLYYSIAGESGIAGAELFFKGEGR